jgi:hypothetical protein
LPSACSGRETGILDRVIYASAPCEDEVITMAEDGDLPRGLAKPAVRALTGAGITRLEQLTALSESELSALHGIGPKAVTLLRDTLHAQGLSFRD